ncbi:hypothetical protein HOO65_020910 [Ceratocystis lukuohia]|uniref:Folliculin-interacting protein N-terminal domain-containing protein n=1 Tax=Ceratocystis lukuohia TaxID=2019550 RepID=A0ABR4MQ05_9PEZI
MLGKLFNLGSGSNSPSSQQQVSSSSSKPVLSLDSVQEDIHTRTLLFPDPQVLQQFQGDQLFPFTSLSASIAAAPIQPFDYNPDICIDNHDVRVIVMQDGMGSSVSSSLLFDSHPFVAPTSPPSSATAERGTIPETCKSPKQSRRSSMSYASATVGGHAMQFEGPQLRSGAFDRRSSTNGRFPSTIETEAQKAGREYREEMATFMSCTFGNSEMSSYKGTSTKVHLYSSDLRRSNISSTSISGDSKGVAGRAGGTRSRLAHSYSSEVMSPGFPPNLSYGTSATANSNVSPSDSKRVLISRLFPVVVPTDNISSAQTQEDLVFKRPQPRPKRTPMYAVVLVINLESLSALGNKAGNFRGPESFTENESLPSSFGSGRRMAWNTPGPAAPEPVDFCIPESDDRMEHITKHWDIIRRTLTQLQSVFATSIGNMLKQLDMAIPDPSSPCPSHRALPINTKANSKLLALPPHCFCNDVWLAKQVDIAQSRIVSGLQAEHVCTGQGRWSTWRDEARVISRLQVGHGIDGRDFFYRLLTGFLATHTHWLQALGPELYRQRHIEREKLKTDEDFMYPARTIIVGKDKMAARRLIFLLSAFLPSKENMNNPHSLRPTTSTSLNFSASPPGYTISALTKEESLRKKINRRSGKSRVPSHHRTPSQSTRNSLVPSALAHLTLDGGQYHGRQDSDDISNRPPPPPPPPSIHSHSGQSLVNTAASEKKLRKSSIAATTTAMPEPAVAHFATLHRHENLRTHRPSSSSSIAADDLKRSLQRSESMSNGSDSTASSSRWGSIMSGLWGGTVRRESVTSVTQSHVSSPIRGGGVSGTGAGANAGNAGSAGSGPRTDPLSPRKSTDKRQELIASLGFTSEQLSSASALQVPISDPEPSPGHVMAPPDLDPRHARNNSGLRSAAEIQPRQPIDMPHPFGSPVKTSINPEDGVIDIDIPFTDFLASFETAVSSPSSGGYLSTPGINHDGLASFERSCRLSSDGDTPLNVAGWLQAFHPDFILQAVPPDEHLMDQIQEALRNEPSPTCFVSSYNSNSEPPIERWVDVSSALVADMTKGTISRIRYRRLIVPRERPIPSRSGKGGPYGGSNLVTPSIKPYEIRHDEHFEVERVGTVEDILTDAIDRVIAQAGDLTSVSSMSDITGPKSIVGSLKTQTNNRLESEVSMMVSSSMPPPSSIFPSINMPTPSLRRTAPRDVPISIGQQAPREVSRAECKSVVLLSLSNLVNDVLAKRDLLAAEDGDDDTYADESVMRGAVRAWLHAADSTLESSPPGVYVRGW